MEYRFFPAGAWVCPACGYENDTDDIPYEEQEDKGNDRTDKKH